MERLSRHCQSALLIALSALLVLSSIITPLTLIYADTATAATNNTTAVDTFEDGSMTTPTNGNWSDWAVVKGGGASTDQGVDANAANGSYAGTIAIIDGSNSQIDLATDRSSPVKAEVVTAWLRHNKESDFGSSFSIMYGSENIADIQMLDGPQIYADGDPTIGFAYTNESGQQQVTRTDLTWENNTYYKVRFELDWQKRTVKAYFGGTFVAKGDINSSFQGIDRIMMETNNDGTSEAVARRFYVDSIRIGQREWDRLADIKANTTIRNLGQSTQTRLQMTAYNASISSLSRPEKSVRVRMKVTDTANSDTGYVFYEQTGATVVDASNGTYEMTVSRSKLFQQLPRRAGENVTVTATMVFNETEPDEERREVTFYAKNGPSRAVDIITNGDVDGGQSITLAETQRILTPDRSYATIESTQPIAQQTNLTYVLAADEVATKYQDAYNASEYDRGDYIWTMTATVDETPIMVFAREKGATRSPGLIEGGFTSDQSYAVYDPAGTGGQKHAQLTVVPRGPDDEQAEVDITMTGNRRLGFIEAYRNFGLDAALSSLGVA